MYKSSKTNKKEESHKYPSTIAYNLLSPPYNPKQKSKGYINSNRHIKAMNLFYQVMPIIILIIVYMYLLHFRRLITQWNTKRDIDIITQ